jgi:hypothetical protein
VSKSDTRRWLYRAEHLFAYAAAVADLPIPELVENRRRSIAMLPPHAPALNRDEALDVLEQLRDALRDPAAAWPSRWPQLMSAASVASP